MYKNIVVGSGPSGSYLSLLLARDGLPVSLFEKRDKNSLGKESCTGIVSDEILKFFSRKTIGRVSVNKIKDSKVFLPGQPPLDIKLKYNFILDRKLFDTMIINRAIDEGAEVYFKHRVERIKPGPHTKIIVSHDGIKEELKAQVLIGSDGAVSVVRRGLKPNKRRRFINGIQARVKLKNSNIILFGLFNKGVWWVVPESKNIARVGVALNAEFKGEYRVLFKDFMRSLKVKNQRYKISFSLIPIFDPRERISYKYKNNREIFLIGDAAGLVKQTTFGGIIPGLKSSKITEEAILNKKIYSVHYKKLWFDLIVNSLSRHILDNMSLEDYKVLREVIKTNAETFKMENRDNLTALLLKVITKDSNFLRILKLSRRFIFNGFNSKKKRLEKSIPKDLIKYL